jgi:hypothetical protein
MRMLHPIEVSARVRLASARGQLPILISRRPIIDRNLQPSGSPEYSLLFLFGSADDLIHQFLQGNLFAAGRPRFRRYNFVPNQCLSPSNFSPEFDRGYKVPGIENALTAREFDQRRNAIKPFKMSKNATTKIRKKGGPSGIA